MATIPPVSCRAGDLGARGERSTRVRRLASAVLGAGVLWLCGHGAAVGSPSARPGEASGETGHDPGPWSFVSTERGPACEALGRQLRGRRPLLAPLLPLPEDPLLAERAGLCGRTIDVLVEAARVELQRDDAVSVSTREDPEQRAEAVIRLEARAKTMHDQRARAAAWLADAERERSRRGLDPSATESMARVLLAWSDPTLADDPRGRAASALAELRAGVAKGSLAPGATARLRFSLAVLSGERPVDAAPTGLPPLVGNEGDFESAVEVLAWARLRDELGLRTRIEAWLRHTGNGGRGDPTLLGVGLGNAERVYLRGLIAVVGDDVDGARAWFRLLLSLDHLDRDLREDASVRLRALEILADD